MDSLDQLYLHTAESAVACLLAAACRQWCFCSPQEHLDRSLPYAHTLLAHRSIGDDGRTVRCSGLGTMIHASCIIVSHHYILPSSAIPRKALPWRLPTINAYEDLTSFLPFLFLNPSHPSPIYLCVPSKLRSSNLHIISSNFNLLLSL